MARPGPGLEPHSGAVGIQTSASGDRSAHEIRAPGVGADSHCSVAVSGGVSATVHIWTDGACLGNPGPGGWGAVLRWNGSERELSGGEGMTTNNRMELMAAIQALDALKRPCEVILTTDSQYVRQGITTWMHNWKRNGWKTSARKPVKNADLWERLDRSVGRHWVSWEWVKGHSGHPENERADALASAAARTAAAA